jgi:hypothetical protein
MAMNFRTEKPKAWEVEKTADGIKALFRPWESFKFLY